MTRSGSAQKRGRRNTRSLALLSPFALVEAPLALVRLRIQGGCRRRNNSTYAGSSSPVVPCTRVLSRTLHHVGSHVNTARGTGIHGCSRRIWFTGVARSRNQPSIRRDRTHSRLLGRVEYPAGCALVKTTCKRRLASTHSDGPTTPWLMLTLRLSLPGLLRGELQPSPTGLPQGKPAVRQADTHGFLFQTPQLRRASATSSAGQRGSESPDRIQRMFQQGPPLVLGDRMDEVTRSARPRHNFQVRAVRTTDHRDRSAWTPPPQPSQRMLNHRLWRIVRQNDQ